MNRRMTITILACLVGLWSAVASAQGKFNPNQVPPIVKQPPIIDPKVIDPKVKLLPPVSPPAAPTVGPGIEPVVKLPPTTSPAAPTGSPGIEPIVKPPPTTLPVDPKSGLLSERELRALEAIRDARIAEELAHQESGLDEVMGAGPAADPLIGGAGIQAADPFAEFCKRPRNRQFAMCAGRGQSGDGLPPDPNTEPEPQFKPARTPFDVPTAGSGMPSRGVPASEDKTETETSPDGSRHDRWTEPDGTQHDLWISSDSSEAELEVYNKDGTFNHSDHTVITDDRGPGARRGDYTIRGTTRTATGLELHWTRHCRRYRGCTDSQPGESGYGQTKARPWFCARNPDAEGCKPPAAGFNIDPANPDGEGTPTGPRPATHRLGREAVVNPGPADSEIRGTTGGGSRPLDMKDPGCQGPDCPGVLRRP